MIRTDCDAKLVPSNAYCQRSHTYIIIMMGTVLHIKCIEEMKKKVLGPYVLHEGGYIWAGGFPEVSFRVQYVVI